MANVELTASQVKELQAVGQAIADINALVSRAKVAGLDVGELEERLKVAETRRLGLLSQFSPGLGPREKR